MQSPFKINILRLRLSIEFKLKMTAKNENFSCRYHKSDIFSYVFFNLTSCTNFSWTISTEVLSLRYLQHYHWHSCENFKWKKRLKIIAAVTCDSRNVLTSAFLQKTNALLLLSSKRLKCWIAQNFVFFQFFGFIVGCCSYRGGFFYYRPLSN